GEAAVKNKVAGFAAFGEYYNAYGPTETSICATVFKNPQGDSIKSERVPIGRPIANTRIYIMNESAQLCAKGVAGEICVSGRGVARGYLNREELTAEKFAADPFREGYRMYKTGDIGRWMENGELEFLGRKDEQVKLRGYRIEPGEIESVLLRQENILQATVTVQENIHGEQELIAFIVSKESNLDIASLRNSLSQLLPAYMLPHHFVALEELPLSQSGKVDKKKLPAVGDKVMAGSTEYVAARNEMEAAVTDIYEEVLKKKQVGVKDDFFVMGGDSIKSIQVVSRLKQRGYSLSIQDVLMHPVVEELCKVMGTSSRITAQGPETGTIGLSPIQRYFFESSEVSPYHYNQSVLLKSNLRLSEQGLQQCLDKLVTHHDALRMTYRFENGEWTQRNEGPEQGYGWEIRAIENSDQLQQHCDEIQTSINLANGPLMKVCLFKSAEEDYLLLVVHHLVIDGVSWRIILEDISELYSQYQKGETLTLPLKTDSFRAWQRQQEQYATSYELQREELYWDEIEQKALSAELLPKDHPGGTNTNADLDHASFV
ncbi:MAG: condensation domain-containing protein, partial [Chitinophagaceae bacterium]